MYRQSSGHAQARFVPTAVGASLVGLKFYHFRFQHLQPPTSLEDMVGNSV